MNGDAPYFVRGNFDLAGIRYRRRANDSRGAGRGLIHNEIPAEGATVHSLQLWSICRRPTK